MQLKSGIYQIRNLLTNKIYIGSAKNLKRRNNFHFWELRNNRHKNGHLQNAFNKYGEENFVFEILAHCPIEYLIKLEQWFLDNTENKYNINPTAGSSLGVICTEETKKKISKSKTGFRKSEETKLKISKSFYENEEERLDEIRKAQHNWMLADPDAYKKNVNNNLLKFSIGKRKPIIQYDLKMNPLMEWESISQATKELDYVYTNIKNVCIGKTAKYKDCIWKYKVL